ncbi:phage head morphogenesis protein [Testudinibacter sp. TR-2022]|nr:phage head morphogenesis protein [Pasteurellaceae bacterium Phil31]TNH12037.1 phage head morphogenesis protein [Testudinibacter sp. TR-2022]TNH12748.1 phage head morphogenesis protein [Testudinibacter sp. TR-2022]TNH13702.1 phage head morphogenesis protein [Testudinibacter sp. TR-2022]TNH17254.1 phage head morphogenesis protein [Testudinibacter sp. TR-2022]
MGYLLRLEPKLAVDYMKAKGYNVTWNWQEQLEAAHAQAFTVAKATRMDVLSEIRTAVEDAVQNGISERDFIKNLQPKLEQMGWWGKQTIVDSHGNAEIVQLGSPRRLKTILRTNRATAYHAGRYAEQMANSDEQPYWQYVAVADSRTRPSHLALHGKVYRFDDPIWNTFYPPNGWGCRCRVRGLSEFRLKKNGLSVSSSEGQLETEWARAGVDKATGEETHVQITKIRTENGTMKTGAGWNYNVGKAAFGTDVSVIRKVQSVQSRELRQETIQAINNSPIRHKAFENWVMANLGKRGASHAFIAAGFVDENIAEKVAELSGGEKYSERILVMTEKSLAHADSPKHHQSGVGLSEKEYASIAAIIGDPNTLVVWDKLHKNLIYFSPDKSFQIVVDSPGKLKKTNEKLDAVINAYKVNFERDVKKAIEGGNYVIIRGE